MKKLLLALLFGLMVMSSMTSCLDESSGSYATNTAAKEESLKAATTSDPVYRPSNFLERKNVNKRAQTMDQPDKIFYIYLYVAGDRVPVGYYIIKGKVSSLRSYLVPQEKIVIPGNRDGGGVVVQDADIDGTYGENVPGIFFFTVNGVYKEWTAGGYLLSETPDIPNVPQYGK